MNAETWQKIKIILEEVLEMPQTSRARFLEKSCAGDEDLQREIELLLKHLIKSPFWSYFIGYLNTFVNLFIINWF